ncbi:hypothetical protein Fcan01_28535 [Folsomia candida]|uniref:Uncharacterized protein n=1 Tax=Folsomia candida TaxID=158441 RepID=A0A226CTB5_FOLCA|nr:hypothetical protein Fcan01_28535 [Folsomia candida]
MTGYMDGQLGGHTLTTVTFRSDILCITVASCYNIIMNLHQRHLLTDHPWVIKKNETCVLTADDKSCRNHTCYTGLLFDLLDKIDAELKNLDDCTLTVVEAVGTYLNTTESEGTWIGGGGLMEIMEKHEADLALALFPHGERFIHTKLPNVDSYTPIGRKEENCYTFRYPKRLNWTFELMQVLPPFLIILLLKLHMEGIIASLRKKWLHDLVSDWQTEKQLTSDDYAERCPCDTSW